MSLHKELREILESRPDIQTVYLNTDGGWLFFEHPAYPLKLSRNEALGNGVKKEEPTPQPTTKQKKTTSK